MKLEIIVAVVLASLSMGERQQRSTVLTDESKRVLEHFDFSNFDKQEGLNYLDRQRYENQVRGKRSQSNIKRNHDKNNGKNQDVSTQLHIKGRQSLKPQTKYQRLDLNNPMREMENTLTHMESHNGHNKNLHSYDINVRRRRGHRYKKKHRTKIRMYKDEDEDENDYEQYRKRKKKKRRRHWDRWSDWSPCSVTCGRGRKIRWRKCIAKNCTTGELEMGEKTCQLPACNLLTKLLGLK